MNFGNLLKIFTQDKLYYVESFEKIEHAIAITQHSLGSLMHHVYLKSTYFQPCGKLTFFKRLTLGTIFFQN